MMGALILVVRGVLPLHSVQAALLCPYRIRFPTAPAEGLYLQNAGFGSNANKVQNMFCTFFVFIFWGGVPLVIISVHVQESDKALEIYNIFIVILFWYH